MTICIVRFQPKDVTVAVPAGALVTEAIHQAGLHVNMPCGGQGRCGRCAVLVEQNGANPGVRRRSSLRLSAADVAQGYALACQSVIEGDGSIVIPPQEKIERRLTSDRTAAAISLPYTYDPGQDQPLRAFFVALSPPTMDDQTDDWARLQRALRQEHGLERVTIGLDGLRKLGRTLRAAEWQVTAIVETDTWDDPDGAARVVDVLAGDRTERLLGAAIDIGTTSNVVYLVDLIRGEVVAEAVDYNGQIVRGEDVISRIIYASKNGNGAGPPDDQRNGLGELQALVLETLNRLLLRAARRVKAEPEEIYRVTAAANSTMTHLFLGLPPESIRLAPFITAVNQPPPVQAGELGLSVHPQASVDCLPGVASYVGADISAGVFSSGLADTDKLTLFLDVGTNGETVLGNQEWMLACACSAGPAFEGAGVGHGMRASAGAIEEVWINSATREPTWRVIGDQPPQGICGSGLISLLAELFITGVLDRSGNFNRQLGTPRLRVGSHGPEYVVAWAAESAHGQDIVLTEVDIDNLLRAKAAIYAGYTVLCQRVGVDPAEVEQVLIGGAFGQYLNVEKAVQIGLLPDLPWERFRFLGNTSARGAALALLSREARQRIAAAAQQMTYLELSADNSFYENFISALFLPHTAMERFPSVAAVMNGQTTTPQGEGVAG
ncbi:MAG: DUF4445 domain-containing protein [Chloroflexi bacterium]|nr:DUF4445 domain-containing protein [Chloroflexota bacterium]